MPYLRVSATNHYSNTFTLNDVKYHDLINEFNSSFCIERQWFFHINMDRA